MSSTRAPGLDQQLRGEVALLGELRVVERLIRLLEIGAAVLPVGVEEQRVEALVEIVVVRDVVARARRRIELREPPPEIAQRAIASASTGDRLARLVLLRSASARKSAIEPCSITSVPFM